MRFEAVNYALGRSVFIKDCTVMMLVGHFLSWMWCLYTYSHLAQFFKASEAVVVVFLLFMCGTVLCSATYGITVSSALYFKPFVVLQYICYLGIFGYGLAHLLVRRMTGFQHCLQIIYLCALSYGLYYCVSVSKAYIAYLRNIQIGNTPFNEESIDIYTHTIVVDDPVVRDEFTESNRCSHIPDSLIDDIFSDYEDLSVSYVIN